jgi:hypothetical protein
MLLGAVPIAFWILIVVFGISFRGFDLTLIGVMLTLGLATYLILLFVTGGSIAWSLRHSRRNHELPSAITSAMIRVSVMLLVLPWLLWVVFKLV